jgi:hypothetical protein
LIISNKVVYLQKERDMGIVVFLVLCLNVLGTIGGGSSKWGE